MYLSIVFSCSCKFFKLVICGNTLPIKYFHVHVFELSCQTTNLTALKYALELARSKHLQIHSFKLPIKYL